MSRAEIRQTSNMKLTYKHTKPARAIEETIDTKLAAQASNDNSPMVMPDEAYPIYYVVKVQVKVWFFWITIWERHCDISDGDSRTVIINEANNLLKAMEGQDNE